MHVSPRIWNVAVPRPQHSAMFGQRASSQIVCSRCAVDQLLDLEVARVRARRAHLHPLGPAGPLGDGQRLSPSRSSLAAWSAARSCRAAAARARRRPRPGARSSSRSKTSASAAAAARPHLVDGDGPAELAGHRRERGVLEAAGGDPLGERRRVEVDVERVAVRRHPARDVDADRGDLPRRLASARRR